MPPERRGFDLGDYIEVKDRIKLFYERFPDGRLVTESVSISADPDGICRVWAHAKAYRTAEDPHPADGWSYMAVPGTTTYTRGSELENTETSAWGRAIAATGIALEKGIASAQDVRNKAAQPEERPQPVYDPEREGLIGTVEIGKTGDADFELRQTPTGYKLGFRLVSQQGKIKAVATSPLAEELKAYQENVVGQRVTAYGRIRDETFRPTGSQRDVTYQVLELTGMRVPEIGDLPAPTPEQSEAATAPLFSPDIEAELDAAVPA